MKERDEDYLRANIKIVEDQFKKGKINNVTAYLLKAFQDDYSIQETEMSKLEKEKEELKKIEIESKEKEESLREEKRQAFEQWKNEQIEIRLGKLDRGVHDQLKEEFVLGVKENDLF